MREPAPPYVGEGPFALWHVSDNPKIDRFETRAGADGTSQVWAVDTRHLPLYWFPRDCPRGTFWADPETSAADRRAFLGGATRVHAIQHLQSLWQQITGSSLEFSGMRLRNLAGR